MVAPRSAQRSHPRLGELTLAGLLLAATLPVGSRPGGAW
jgi:hypothetical protein